MNRVKPTKNRFAFYEFFWFNNFRLFEPIGSIPPAELEEAYYTDFHTLRVAAGLTYKSLR